MSIDSDLSKRLDSIETLMNECLNATLKCLGYFEQLSEQYEQLRFEHNKNHGDSIAPIQMLMNRRNKV